jgi:hypothetical protein
LWNEVDEFLDFIDFLGFLVFFKLGKHVSLPLLQHFIITCLRFAEDSFSGSSKKNQVQG